MQMNAFGCHKIVAQNLQDARNFTNDEKLFSNLGDSLLMKWDVPMYGHRLTGGVVKKEYFLVDWPRLSLDVFEVLKEYDLKQFYEPLAATYGPLQEQRDSFQDYINESLLFMNHCLRRSVKMVNSTL